MKGKKLPLSLYIGKQVDYPRHAPVATFKKAQRVRKVNGEEQNRLP